MQIAYGSLVSCTVSYWIAVGRNLSNVTRNMVIRFFLARMKLVLFTFHNGLVYRRLIFFSCIPFGLYTQCCFFSFLKDVRDGPLLCVSSE